LITFTKDFDGFPVAGKSARWQRYGIVYARQFGLTEAEAVAIYRWTQNQMFIDFAKLPGALKKLPRYDGIIVRNTNLFTESVDALDNAYASRKTIQMKDFVKNLKSQTPEGASQFVAPPQTPPTTPLSSKVTMQAPDSPEYLGQPSTSKTPVVVNAADDARYSGLTVMAGVAAGTTPVFIGKPPAFRLVVKVKTGTYIAPLSEPRTRVQNEVLVIGGEKEFRVMGTGIVPRQGQIPQVKVYFLEEI
jgi:hypothetical protein